MSESARPSPRAWGWRQAALVFALALIPRLAHWCFVRHTPLAGEYVPDLSAYLFAASRLMDSAYFFVEPMLMSPGYALVLAPQYILFGPDIPLFVLTNAVLDAGSAALCAGLAARLASRLAAGGRERLAGLVAGLLYALCGPLLFYTLLPLGEGPAVFCLLAGLSLLLAAPQRGSLCAWLAGAIFALGALIRPNLAPALLFALAVWCLAPGRDRKLRLSVAARCLLGFFLVLSPFMAHNAAVAGRPSPFGFQGGFTLYSGNHPGASGVGDALPGFDNTPYLVVMQAWQQAEEQSGRELTLAQADAWWYGRTWRFFAEHPAEAAGLLGRKFLLLVNPQGVDATVNQGFCDRFSPVPGLLALPLGLVFALAAAGLLLRFGPGSGERDAAAWALAAALVATAGLLVLFQVTPRYRVVFLPLTLPFAALALAEVPALLRGAGMARRGAALGAFGLVLGLSLVPLSALVDKPGVAFQEHARLANYYLLKGPQALAQQEFRAALDLNPGDAGLRAGLAASRLLQGQDATRPLP